MKTFIKLGLVLAIAAALASCVKIDTQPDPEDAPALGWEYKELGAAEQTATNTVFCEFDYAEVVFSWEGLMSFDPVTVATDMEGKCLFASASYEKPSFSVTFSENVSTRYRKAVVTLFKDEKEVATFTVKQNGKEEQQ